MKIKAIVLAILLAPFYITLVVSALLLTIIFAGLMRLLIFIGVFEAIGLLLDRTTRLIKRYNLRHLTK